MALADWKLTPDWINENWSEELLAMMFIARGKRINKTLEPQRKSKTKQVTNDEFFRRHPQIKVVKHG